MRECLFPHGLHQHWVLSMLPFSKYVGGRDSPKLAFLVILRFFHFGIHLVNICIYSSVLWPFSIRFLTYQFEEFNYIQWILTIFCYKCPDIFCQLVNHPFDFEYPASCRMELHHPKPPSWHFSRPFHCSIRLATSEWYRCDMTSGSHVTLSPHCCGAGALTWLWTGLMQCYMGILRECT